VGADLLMVLPPDWAHSCTTQTFVEHYAAIAREMPVMMVTGVFASRGVAQGVEIVRAVLEQVDGVVAIKDDFCGEFARKMCRLAKGRAATFSGGQKQNHLDALPYGCDGYLSTFITFKPSVTHEYWRAIQSNDLRRATAIIERYDVPFFDFILSLPGGFDAGMHATYELFGLGERWRRPPYHSLSDAELERLAGFFRALKLL
jgi:dihydrodipicolinate synthase/N-acetylneuraminate lyase